MFIRNVSHALGICHQALETREWGQFNRWNKWEEILQLNARLRDATIPAALGWQVARLANLCAYVNLMQALEDPRDSKERLEATIAALTELGENDEYAVKWRAILMLRRAQAYLQLGQSYDAERFCDSVLELAARGSLTFAFAELLSGRALLEQIKDERLGQAAVNDKLQSAIRRLRSGRRHLRFMMRGRDAHIGRMAGRAWLAIAYHTQNQRWRFFWHSTLLKGLSYPAHQNHLPVMARWPTAALYICLPFTEPIDL